MKTPDYVDLVALQSLANKGVAKGDNFKATPEEARVLLRDGYARASDLKPATTKSK